MSQLSNRTPTRTQRPKRPLRAAARSLPLVPSMVVFAIFMLGPILYAFWGSLTNAELSGRLSAEPEFIGADNYIHLLTNPELYKSILITVIFVLGSAIIGQNGLGLAIALLQRKTSNWGKQLISTCVVTAWVLPEIVSAFAGFAYFADEGTLNTLVTAVGAGPVSWLYEHALIAIILANIWRGTAFSMLIYSAALSEVSPDILEAATMDGANEWQQTFRIIIPVIKRSVATNMMLVTLQTMGVFTTIWVMTAGGPGTATTTLPIMAYDSAFKTSQVGMGTAVSTILLVLGALMSIIYIKMLKPEES